MREACHDAAVTWWKTRERERGCLRNAGTAPGAGAIPSHAWGMARLAHGCVRSAARANGDRRVCQCVCRVSLSAVARPDSPESECVSHAWVITAW